MMNRRLVAAAGASLVHQSIWFVLRPASSTDLNEFQAPPTPWRIDSSVAALGSAHRVATDASDLAVAGVRPSST